MGYMLRAMLIGESVSPTNCTEPSGTKVRLKFGATVVCCHHHKGQPITGRLKTRRCCPMTPNKNDLCNNNMRTMSSSIRIVDDEVEEQRIPRGTGIIRPVPQNARNLVKPVAIKVVRPIPQRVTEQFYKEACEEGLNLKETSVAAAIANDWHRKWTQQDEQNHTTPNADFYATSELHTEDYDFDADRLGARNPSIFSDDGSEAESFDGGVKRSLHFAPSPQPPTLKIDFRRLHGLNPIQVHSAHTWHHKSRDGSSALQSLKIMQTKLKSQFCVHPCR